jgi:hypothetical protein
MSSDGAKVTGYIRQSVYNRLLDFKEAYQLKSVSQAVTLILEDYLGIESLGETGSSLSHRISTVEERLERLNEVVISLDALINKPASDLALQYAQSQVEDGHGITQAELAHRLRVRESTISRNKGKLTFTQWSKRKDPAF